MEDTREVISSIQALPLHKRVLTADGAPFALQPSKQTKIVILESVRSDKTAPVCIIVTSETFRKEREYMTVRARVKTLGWAIEDNRIALETVIAEANRKSAGGRSVAAVSAERDAPQTKEVNTQSQEMFISIVRDAWVRRSSDIHIEVRQKEANILFRVHGELEKYQAKADPQAIREMVTSAFNTLSEPDSHKGDFNPSQRMSALIELTVEGDLLRLRFASQPVSPMGFDAVLRINPIGFFEGVKTFEQLGYTESQRRQLTRAFSKPTGAILIAGVTGSGKSTTLQNALIMQLMLRPGIKVRTIEDPVEYLIAGASQHPVARSSYDADEERSEDEFTKTIITSMRMDPDFLMVGEVRDDKTARALLQSVQSGHQTAATVHTPSANAIVGRLEELGIQRSILSHPDFFSALVYQRLLPVLCLSCRRPYSPDLLPRESRESGLPERLEALPNIDLSRIYLKNPDPLHVCKSRGCHHGIVGRTVCAEVMLPDPTMLDYFSRGEAARAQDYWWWRDREHHGGLGRRHWPLAS
jgi:general secretion pathway protein E